MRKQILTQLQYSDATWNKPFYTWRFYSVSYAVLLVHALLTYGTLWCVADTGPYCLMEADKSMLDQKTVLTIELQCQKVRERTNTLTVRFNQGMGTL